MAEAQSTAIVRGTVTQVDAATPAVGIVVVAVDTAGAEVARSLSGSAGGFFLTVAAPARYVIRALRIGFRPTTLPAIDVAAGETRTLAIALSGEGVQLGVVRVEGVSICRMDATTGREVAALWDQARTALAASTLSAGGRSFEATLASYRQYTPRGDRVIQAESVIVVKQTTTSGFVSVPAESLAATGYFVQDGTRYAYHSPDAKVLLSAEFASAHCFRVLPGGPAHPDWVGIGFRPAANRSKFSEVDGALWLDRTTAELRKLEYKYVNLPASSGWDADGAVTFTRLLTGDWIIARWAIRTPVTEEHVGARAGQPRFVTLGTQVVGGTTRVIEQDGIALYRDSSASLTVTLRARDSLNTHVEGHVILFGTQHEGYADAKGVASLNGLTQGRFRAMIWTPFMTWLGVKAIEREVDVDFEEHRTIDVPLPSADEVAAQRCGRSPAANVRFVYGTVKRRGRMLFQRERILLERPALAAARAKEMAAKTLVSTTGAAGTDEFGQWQACTRLAGPVAVSLIVDGRVVATRTLSVPAGRMITRIDFSIP